MDDVSKLMEELDQMVQEAKTVPFSGGKVVVDKELILEQLDKIRLALPDEVGKSKEVLGKRDDIVNSAVQEAERYMEDSRRQAEKILNEQEIVVMAQKRADDIVKAAEQQAEQIVAEANQQANEVRDDADNYAYQLMEHIEIVLKRGLDTVQQGKDELGIQPAEEEDLLLEKRYDRA